MPYRPIIGRFPRSSAPVNVYLLHFSRPFGHASHYIGVTTRDDIETRVAEHQAGRGARLCAEAARAGILLVLARTWLNVPRLTETRLKNRGGARRLCPICRPSPP